MEISFEDELVQRILCELDDLKDCELLALANTILTIWRRKTGNDINPVNDISQIVDFCNAAKRVFKLGYVTVFMERLTERNQPVSKDDAAVVLENMEDWFEYNPQTSLWARTMVVNEHPSFEITDEGEIAARKVLDARGYRWWDLELPEE